VVIFSKFVITGNFQSKLRIFFSLTVCPEFRSIVGYSSTVEEFRAILSALRQRFEGQMTVENGIDFLDGTETTLAEKVNKIPNYFAKPYVRHAKEPSLLVTEDRKKRKVELQRIQAETGLSFRQIRKREKRRLSTQRNAHQKKEVPLCFRCKQPAGKNCQNSACKKCCRFTCIHSDTLCITHGHSEKYLAPKRESYLKNRTQLEAEMESEQTLIEEVSA